MVGRILLSDGQEALVDDEDFELVSRSRWFVSGGRCGYVCRWDGRRNVALHRDLMTVPAPLVIDHINGDRLDNRRSNLRAATTAQNLRNRGPSKGRALKGVHQRRPGSRWSATIMADGVKHWLGTYGSPEEAARAYDRRALEVHGKFAALNFPEER